MDSRGLIFITACLSLTLWAVIRFVASVSYDQEVGGYLKLAADANSIDHAEANLEKAIQGMDARGIVCEGKCFTSVLYQTPDEDVGYWRRNIVDALDDLHEMSDDERSDNLIVSNQLIKLRETLLDSGSEGDVVTSPSGISIYGKNVEIAWWALISIVLIPLGGLRLRTYGPNYSERNYFDFL